MSSVKRGAESNYAVMSNEDILSLRIKDIADPNGCVLALWVPSSLLKLGMSVMENWGFECKSTYVWVKTKKEPLAQVSSAIQNASKSPSVKSLKEIISSIVQHTKLGDMLGFGMGRLFRQSHEICLIGINNNKIYRSLENKSQRSVCMAPNEGHSIKPEALHDSLELMFPNAEKIELFARREKAGWTTLGNEIDGRDIRDAIEDLINAA
jgi:N6-adenosine-specific RNA methylase IME4